MAVNIKGSHYRYSITEHIFIFLSLIFAFVLSEFLIDFYLFVTSNKIFHCFDYFINTLWAFFLFALILESWWGAWIDQKNIFTFFDFLLFLISPMFLFIFEKILLDFEKLHIKENLFIYNYFNVIFFSFLALLAGYLTLLRHHYASINNWKQGRILICLLSLVIALFLLIFGNHISKGWAYFLPVLHGCFFLLCFIILIDHTIKNRNRLMIFSSKDFINEVISHASIICRNKLYAGFILVDSTKVPFKVTNKIMKTLRSGDLWALGDDKVYYFFVSGSDSIAGIEESLISRIKEIEKYKKDIIINYKQFSSNNNDNKGSECRHQLQTLFEATYDRLMPTPQKPKQPTNR